MSIFKKSSSNIKIGKKSIGEGSPTFFIAEIGNNHNGDYYLARRLVKKAKEVGADAVKFQKRFINETFAKELRDKPQTKDQVLGKTYGEYRENLELTESEFIKLKKYAKKLDLIFFATPFDHKSADFLEKVGVDLYKISSFDVTNIPLLEHVAKKNKPVILSVGMADQDEAKEAVKAILKHNKKLVILHCISIYPTPDDRVNLLTIPSLGETYEPIPVGYSGHEKGFLATLAAVSLGAKCIERHFTLDKNLPGPDHSTVSIDPDEFKSMVENSRRIEKMLGNKGKMLWKEELKTKQKHSKSLVAKVNIPKGAKITKNMIVCKSPGHGLRPKMLNKVIGKKAKRNIKEDSVLKSGDVSK